MFELLWLLVYLRAESRTLCYLFTFERSREPYPTLLLVYVRAESRTLRYLFMFERSREPCLCSSLSDTLFMFERSREPCSTCLRSSGVENPVLLYSLFTFERSRELLIRQAKPRTLPYLFTFERSRELFVMQAESRTLPYFSPCLCSSEVENLPDTLFTFDRSREHPFE